ncbi:hypothetical protein [Mesorhizobium sp. NZP2077]|uniref:hypothetical protein n=1 Tax=Mesorhizobium sp. NZP2077 TaxID=2483404 RepID=UPI001557020F|nr:hypothetical protein [Mesorhizobium sp. NZP2077]QKC83957.1 hypothetical protein EB232_22275 [Mesorhizobium sp. NZP2077]QKD17494.1 hypothetical protein HGP13_21980 [Mesorhizobium sp. NZP2077]
MADQPKAIKFHYIKSPLARDIHVNGVFGGINPVTGDLHLSVFAERPPIPTAITFELSSEGSLGPEVGDSREGRDGMVRIVQDTLYLDFATALSLHQWLKGHLGNFLKAHPEIVLEDEL